MKGYKDCLITKKHRLHPLTLLLVNACVPFMNTFFPSGKVLAFAYLISLGIILFFGNFPAFLKTGSFVVLFWSAYYFFLFNFPNKEIITGFRMSMLFVPSGVLAYLFITSYHSSEILSSLEKLRLPKIFIIGLTVTLRYIPTFKKEFGIIKSAMQIRGVKFSFLRPFRTFEYLVVPQLFRCLSLSGELTAAALTKGINAPNRRSSFFALKFHFYDVGIVVFMFIGYGLLIGKMV